MKQIAQFKYTSFVTKKNIQVYFDSQFRSFTHIYIDSLFYIFNISDVDVFLGICFIVGNHRMYFIENGKVLGGEVMVGEWTEGAHLQKHACGRVLGNKTEWEKWSS